MPSNRLVAGQSRPGRGGPLAGQAASLADFRP